MRLRLWMVVLALCLLAGCALLSLSVGAAGIPPLSALRALAGFDAGLAPIDLSVLYELRLPRVVMGMMVGGLLAIAGAGYQGVFRNPLADPYLLGAAAGAGLGATIVIIFFSGVAVVGVPVAAFAGALGGVLLAYTLGSTAGRAGGLTTLVLAGVVVGLFLDAVQTFVQMLRVEDLRRIYSWILGGLGTAEWPVIRMVAPYAVVSIGVLLVHGRLLDVLSVGDDEAAALGLRAARVRLTVLVAASLATASAVAVSGLIGFVGLVIPHLVRRAFGTSYRVLLPMSMILGASFMVLADLLARTAIAPGEIPLGVVTAFVGGPFFLLVLRTTRQAET